VRRLDLPDGEILVAATEDLIADRLGQWEASNRRSARLLRQAQLLFALAGDLDDAYLDRRIREETAGSACLSTLRDERP